MQSIKEWHTPSERAHDQQSISISSSVDSPFIILLLFASLFIAVAQNKYWAGAQSCIPRRRKCSITKMSRCFKNEICLCVHSSNETDEVWPRLLLFCTVLMHQNNERRLVSRKGGRWEKQVQESCRATFMVAIISCQQHWLLSVSLCALDNR